MKRIELEGEDGYSIVTDFIASYDEKQRDGSTKNRLKNEICQGENSPYTGGLISRYGDFAYPAWAFVEVISFGSFLYFYKFCADRFGNQEMKDTFYLLQAVKSLRNACAHNNCILNDMGAGSPRHKPRYAVMRELSTISGIGSNQRKSKMSNERIQQIVTTLYMHRMLASQGVLEHRADSLMTFVERMKRHIDYYKGNLQVSTGFSFLTKVIMTWYPVTINNAESVTKSQECSCKRILR